MPSTPSPNDLTRQQLDELDSLLQRMLSLPLSNPQESPTPKPVAPAPVAASFAAPSLPMGWRADHATVPPKPAFQSTAAIDEEELPALAAQVAPLSAEFHASPNSSAPSASGMTPWGSVGFSGELPLPPGSKPFGPPSFETGVPPSVGPYLPSVLPPEPESEPAVHTGTLRGVDAPALPAGFQPPSLRLAPEPSAIPEETEAPAEDFAELTPIAPAEPEVEPEPIPSPVRTARSQGSRVPVVMWPVFAVNWILERILGCFGPVGDVLTHPAMKHLLGWSGWLLLAGAGAWAARGMGWIQLPF